MSTYQGHLPDGSSVQKHSAGGLYPYVIFKKAFAGVELYGVLTPLGDEFFHSTYDKSVEFATTLKNAH